MKQAGLNDAPMDSAIAAPIEDSRHSVIFSTEMDTSHRFSFECESHGQSSGSP